MFSWESSAYSYPHATIMTSVFVEMSWLPHNGLLFDSAYGHSVAKNHHLMVPHKRWPIVWSFSYPIFEQQIYGNYNMCACSSWIRGQLVLCPCSCAAASGCRSLPVWHVRQKFAPTYQRRRFLGAEPDSRESSLKCLMGKSTENSKSCHLLSSSEMFVPTLNKPWQAYNEESIVLSPVTCPLGWFWRWVLSSLNAFTAAPSTCVHSSDVASWNNGLHLSVLERETLPSEWTELKTHGMVSLWNRKIGAKLSPVKWSLKRFLTSPKLRWSE